MSHSAPARIALLGLAVAALISDAAGGRTRGTSDPYPPAREGIVRASRRAIVDDGGAFLALGTTLFWGLWGYEQDRERLAQNLDAVARGGFDYIRVLGSVGWPDRSVDPAAANWSERAAAFNDWVFDTYHLRVQWTLFGDVEGTPTIASRRRLVDRWSAAFRDRHHKVFAVEIANEGWQNGFDGAAGRAELKALAVRLHRTYPGLIATTAARGLDCGGFASYYRNARASLLTLHLSRSLREQGVWQPVNEPWRAGSIRCGGIPEAYSSNEPIGPYSSVNEERDPLRLAAGAAVTWLAGIGAYVLHTGAGIRGGGAADRERGRPANLWDVENWEQTTAALRRVRALLPPDLPNWTRLDQTHRRHPFRNRTAEKASPVVGQYAAHKGRRFVTAVIGISDETSLVAKRSMMVRIVNPLTGHVQSDGSLPAGGALTLTPDVPAVLILGEWR